jgi:hypothetical protein
VFRRFLETADVTVGSRTYEVRYYVSTTLRGAVRYSSEIRLGPSDLIILDDSCLNGLISKVARLAPATIYSRLLVARATAA